MVLLRNKIGVGVGQQKYLFDRPQGPTMAQFGISLALETAVTGSLLESRQVK